MPVIVFLIDKPTSHVLASLGLARRLERLGYTPEYWGDCAIGHLVADQGYTFRKLDGMWPRYQDNIRLPTSRSLRALALRPFLTLRIIRARRRVRAQLPGDLDRFSVALNLLVESIKPVLFIFDPFLLGYYPYVRRLGVAMVVLSTKPLPIPDEMTPPYTSYLLPHCSRYGRWRVRMSWVRALFVTSCGRVCAQLARACGAFTYDQLISEAARRNGVSLRDDHLRRRVHCDLHVDGIDEWALWSPAMDFPRKRPLPKGVHYVGASVDVARKEVPLPFEIDRSKRLVYVEVGTVKFRWKDNLPFLRKVLAAFENVSEVLLVISTGDSRASLALTAEQPNALVFDFLPQLRLLEIADLAITHGGAGTFRECVQKEVPMLVYPSFHDQMGNSARIVSLGLGLRGRRGRDSAADIRRKSFAVMRSRAVRANLRRVRLAVEGCQARLLIEAMDNVLPRDMASSPRQY